MTRLRVLVWVVAAVLVAAACGGGDDGGNGGGGAADAARCGLDELAAATASGDPVEITFWHQQVDRNGEVLAGLIDEFHAAQDTVRVRLVEFADYEEIFQKWRASLDGGDLPDLVVMEETAVQALVDSQSTIPVQACVEAERYDLSDYLPRAIAYYTVGGVLAAMPWNVSNPVLYYDRAAFARAGLDPDDPPATLEEVRAASQAIVDAGVAPHGIALRSQDYYNEFWYAKGGQVYVDHDNGRSGRAEHAQLDTEFGLELWTWWDEMVSSGLALDTGHADGNIDHMLAIGNGEAVMSIEASSALGPIAAVLESGQFEGLKLGVAALPGLREGGGVPVGDGALWIAAASPPERRAAAWQLARFLTQPEQQATLHMGAGYVPVRQSVAELPEIVAFWEEQPAYRVAYDQLVEGPTDAATSGSLIGDYQGVRDAVTAGLDAMLVGDAIPAEALALAQREADAAIADYNARVSP